MQNMRDEEQNSLCEVAFNCMRQFAGISMLVKERCFACGNPHAPRCACQVACFCAGCEDSAVGMAHRKVCRLVRAAPVAVDEECVQLMG